MSSSGPYSYGAVPTPYNSTSVWASPMAKARSMGSGKGSKSGKGKSFAPDIGADDTDEQDMPTTIEELQQRVREQKKVIKAACSSYTQGYVKGRMVEVQKWTAIVEQMKIDYNDAVIKGKMLEYDRLNEMERDRLEKLRREIEDKLAQNCIL